MILNKRLLLFLSGTVLMLEGAFMAACIPVAMYYGGADLNAFIISAIITFFSGALLRLFTWTRVRKVPTPREGFLFVSFSWILISLFGVMPYMISGAIPNFVNAYFETVSGFTTTGSSILTDIEALPKGILFWRSITHWMGGMGVILMVIVILPSLKAGGILLYSAETTRASFDNLRPRVIDTAKSFGMVYLALTLLETIFLTLGGMPLFDSVCHSFATVATGGFSTKNDSIAGYPTYIHYVIIIFMFLSGANFGLHFLLAKGKFKEVLANEEFRVYTGIILIITLLIMVILMRNGMRFAISIRDSLFQVTSIVTCTGFATADYMLWPRFAWFLIFMAMFSGASAGSTGGGVKVIRHVLMFKNLAADIKSFVHPKGIYTVKYQGAVLSPNRLQSVVAFYYWYLLIFISGSVVMMAMGVDFHASIGSVATTLAGIGPGLGKVGPSGNFSSFPDMAKIFLTFNMIIGRLEIYSFLVIFSPAFWKF